MADAENTTGSAYLYRFNRDALPEEPSDQQSAVLARALAHWVAVYPERTVGEIVADILACNEPGTSGMTPGECETIAAVCGVSDFGKAA